MKPNHTAEQAIPVERLRDEFLYTPSTGRLIHRRPKAQGGGKVFALQPAGTLRYGYLTVRVDGRAIRAHRVAYAMHTGRWPDGYIDHIDRNRLNNRIENLRVATKEQNGCNSGLFSSNTSGIRGVSWKKSSGRWVSNIMVNGKLRHLGYYDDIETAAMVRRIAEHSLWGGLHAFPEEEAA